ncbi:FabD/lysophospholipase-like protein [Dendrothele bispora CBS 962.96]|uniref:FabD/lysophospholipase-like protein n=1 Tax=Dendrothele bispora (strain CBS 962.96) TaxID=1314807 RepID=A0A4S8M8P6_DENBC|nr:FabD/lysophospholipase-like protein [Dendrothele bispora CBS 962.96]
MANPPQANNPPVNLLSLDGGGIRGVSELIILHEIMVRLKDKKGLSDLPKPCEYFHLIGGTSTGGLIAIMLGRLEMNTEEALAQYKALAGRIFGKKNQKSKGHDGAFKATTLEEEMKKLLQSCRGDPEALMCGDVTRENEMGRAALTIALRNNNEAMTRPKISESDIGNHGGALISAETRYGYMYITNQTGS